MTLQELRPREGDALALNVKENEEITIIERGNGKFTVEIKLGPNAKVNYYSNTTGNVTRNAILDQDSAIQWVDVATGTGESHTKSTLKGKGADAEFHSVLLGTGTDQFSVTSEMDHQASNTTSNMLTRAVMLCESKGAYAGTIRIAEDAKNCDAYQKEETLLLSQEAKMDAQPNLEISNPEVSCSHGVSIGELDAEKLFYLTSRGLSKEKAVHLVIRGFFDEVLDRMGDHSTEFKDMIHSRTP